ncbi:MAG: endonuclease/exonuclease/phosphatase family protein [Candidatus Sifarchaeia archaeon]
MTKAFSVVSWNIKKFKGDKARAERVAVLLENKDPDVFAIYEASGGDVFLPLAKHLKGYTFHTTEGRQSQEIVVGVKNDVSAFITQKTEFQSGASLMRPGLLVTVERDSVYYPLLFLHLASSPDPRGMGLRDDMLDRAFHFKKILEEALQAIGQAKANYMFLGDLNTMGLKYPFGVRGGKHGFDGKVELAKWDRFGNKDIYAMQRLSKTHDVTYRSHGGHLQGNLDHVYAEKHLRFKKFNKGSSGRVDVEVSGWVDQTSEQDIQDWISKYSDHSMLYLEVQKP